MDKRGLFLLPRLYNLQGCLLIYVAQMSVKNYCILIGKINVIGKGQRIAIDCSRTHEKSRIDWGGGGGADLGRS